MKILHLPSTFLPRHTGGKEIFVYQLIKNTIPLGVEHTVLIHENGTHSYQYEGVHVHVLPKQKTRNQRYSYFSGQYDDLAGFEMYLKELAPDLVHFHDQGEGASLSHLQFCKSAGVKTLLTYHSPGQSCSQRALLFAGKSRCAGKMDDQICTVCRYQISGIPAGLANLMSNVRVPFVKTHPFIQRNNIESFNQNRKEFFDTVDGIQIHAIWVKNLLLLNKVPESKIHFIKFGGNINANVKEISYDHKIPLKLVFIGRCSYIKGVHLLVNAILRLPKNIPIEVHFFGPYWDDTSYGRDLLERIAGDARFKAPRLIRPELVVEALSEMDVCIIPSLWPETGPLTLFDSFAARLPVIATNYAGIAERVTDGENGLLFKWGDDKDLENKILQLVNDREQLKYLRHHIKVESSFYDMALAIYALYEKLLN